MDMETLEDEVGIRYNLVRGRERLILPPEKWKYVCQAVDDLGTTRLMLAAREGSRDYVDFLLKCGAEVNAVDRRGLRAVDHSLAGNNLEVTLLLLQWDSLLPFSMKEDPNKTLDDLKSDGIGQFFVERDGFHKMLIEGTPDSVEEYLKKADNKRDAPRYWVNSHGLSALYVAGNAEKFDVWALLRASGFAYANSDEEESMKCFENDDAFHFAIGKYFVPLTGCHVQKMVAKSMVYLREGEDSEEFGEKVEQYFREIDKVEFGSEILMCLQDDDSLEIVFDFSSTDVQNMHPTNMVCHIYGLTDLKMDRIYVAAMESSEFDHSDVVSNLMHELTHQVLALVFKNQGLPFKMGDLDTELKYRDVIEKVMCEERLKKCDRIIQRAAGTLPEMSLELIVRVPEMMVKYMILGNELSESLDGLCQLREQAPELLNFYAEYVAPAIRQHISGNRSANMVARSQVLRYFKLLSTVYDKNISVSPSYDKSVQTCQHNKLAVMKVSNLKLAVSHLKLSFGDDITVVDWSKFQAAGEYFSYAVCRGEIKKLALVWDQKDQQPFFCRATSICSKWECMARKLESLVHRIIFVIPKEFYCLPNGTDIDYAWNDLSDTTKDWILEKVVDFGGFCTTIRSLISSMVDTEDIGNNVKTFFGVDEISTVIDEQVLLGKPFESLLQKRKELLHSHPECFVPRKLRVSRIEFSMEFFKKRTKDVFFFCNVEERYLVEAGFNQVHVWDGTIVPEGIRCIIIVEITTSLAEELGRISGRIRGNWHFAHFFTRVRERFIHDCSLKWSQVLENPENIKWECTGYDILKCSNSGQSEAYVISDVPGSGKSVFMNETARILKKKQPHCWVGVVDLPLHEERIKSWSEAEMVSYPQMAVDLVYELLKAGSTSIEKRVFNTLCHIKGRVIIIFDAFDEICPNYKLKVMALLKSLTRVMDAKLCIATRTHESSDLEDGLFTLAYSFVPFDRSEQIKFLDAEWNASLKMLPCEERAEKVHSITASLQSHYDSVIECGIASLLEDLKMLANVREKSRFKPVSFVKLAEILIAGGKFVAQGEVDFSETPLHAWMFASVAFEENFNFPNSLSLPQLYKRFVDLKIKLYSKEKAKALDYVAGDSKEALFKVTAYELLKKFSVFYFLEEKEHKLTMHELPHILRIGIVVERSGSVMFVHKTFGEYLFSLWLLEKAKKRKVTLAWLQQVLLDGKFEKVRQFIDSLLCSEYEKKLSRDFVELSDWKVSSLCRSAIPSVDRLVEAIQKCLYTSIVEHHEGILRYLLENSRETASEVIFSTPLWDIKTLPIQLPNVPGMKCRNSINLCGHCIKQSTMQVYSQQRQLPLQHLKLLSSLLRVVENYRLTSFLNRFIAEDGLWWMGISESSLWKETAGKEHFVAMFDYLAKHGNAFPVTMKENIFDNGELITNIAVHAFFALVSLSNIVFSNESFLEYISEKDSFSLAWKGVIEKCGVDEVQGMWRYLEKRLVTSGRRKEFLSRKDRKERGPLFAAFRNFSHPNTLPFVWQLFQDELNESECKKFLFDGFSGVQDPYTTVSEAFVDWLQGLFSSGYLNVMEVAQLLLSTDKSGSQYFLLSFHNYQSPRVVYMLQEILFAGCNSFKEVMQSMGVQCVDLAPLCFKSTSWLRIDESFESVIQAGYSKFFDAMAQYHPFVVAVNCDHKGYLTNTFHWNKVRVKGIMLKAYVVLLWRQLCLVHRILGKEYVLRFLKKEWSSIYFLFPEVLMQAGCGENILRKTDSILLSSFISVVSSILSKAEVAELLFSIDCDRRDTGFHWAMFQDDAWAFLALYDGARWAVGEDALWMVHSVPLDDVTETVLEVLQKKSALFDHV
ncbi:uncharacterized protein LOC124168015 [Ischnura elegans]|uniref:uncharacterized protein LOC124168015 n=1 Tax=Ischnura elegans TaxID=197161 RepID=UPI001ED88CAE|nr:uncharacterized protein LOC124168015 [Ischnura elegans]